MQKLLFFILLAGCLSPLATALAELPDEFVVGYELSRNDSILGETTLTLESRDGNWHLTSKSDGTRGLARLIGFHEHSWSEGDWQNGKPRPQGFEQNIKIAIKKIHWSADFDWPNGIVNTVHEDGESKLNLEPGVVDPSTIGLLISTGLASGETKWQLRVVDEDKIEDQRFELVATEQLDTPLGCLQTMRVEKIRHETSKRYTRTYYAKDLGFVPVRIEHGKHGGDHNESSVVSLSLNGREINPVANCPE